MACGYPDKMMAEDIPLAARIVAIADAFDAMATDRPYKKALPLEECEAILRKTAGKMYDPELIEVFVSAILGRSTPTTTTTTRTKISTRLRSSRHFPCNSSAAGDPMRET